MAYTFLIIDDSSIVRKTIKKALSLSGLPIREILEAGDGLQALEVLDNGRVDLIFLDINMPVMDGLVFVEKLRQREKDADTPVVVVSTEGSLERQKQLRDFAVRAYLRKPVTPEQLSETVHSILQGGHRP